MIDLYSWTTPNGRKVSIALEEMGLPYTVHAINIGKDEQFAPDFLKISPNNRIPAIVDREKNFSLFESGAILMYLAEKTGKLMPKDTEGRYRVIEWLMWQMGGVGPMFGQVGFFHKYAGREYEDKRPLGRYVNESARLLGVLDGHLKGRAWMLGDEYTIADIAIFPWVRNLVGWYEAGELVGFERFAEVRRVLDAFLARPAVQRGLKMPQA